MKFEEYFSTWLNGIADEIDFWDDYMSSEGGVYHDDYEWTVKKNKAFTLDDEVEQKGVCDFIDVGSGPFSRCGTESTVTDLRVTAVDPLGYLYEKMKNKYQLNNGVFVNTGFVELLDNQFEPESFDIVHMSNSLDHSFDPIFGLYQLMRICKINGKIILRHTENEALAESYKGLHQWNLSLKRIPGKFCIWNRNESICVNDLLSPYATIETVPDLVEGNGSKEKWIYNKVVIKKKRNIDIPYNSYRNTIFNKVYDKLLDMTFETCISGDKCNYRTKRASVLRNAEHIVDSLFVSLKIASCDIYGMGIIGKKIYDIIINRGWEVSELYDKQEICYRNRRCISVENEGVKNDDYIIVTAINSFIEIKEMLISKGVREDRIVSILKMIEDKD